MPPIDATTPEPIEATTEVVPPPEPPTLQPIPPANDIGGMVMPANDIGGMVMAINNVGARLTSLATRVEVVENAPTRFLNATPPPPEALPPEPRIEVASPYDHLSPIGMLFCDDIQNKMASSNQITHLASHQNRSNEWWRALTLKFGKLLGNQPPPPPQLAGVDNDGKDYFYNEDSIISLAAYQTLHKRVPYLNANEVMRTDFTGYGLELIPTLFNQVMYHLFRAESKVFGLFQVFTPTSYPTFTWPKIISGPVFRLVKEATDDSQSSYANSPIPISKMGTGNVEFNAGGIGARTSVTQQEVKGSSAPLLEAMLLEYARATAQAIDWVLVNGDETDTAANISNIGAIPSTTIYDSLLAMDGLRHMSLVTNTTDSVVNATVAITSLGIGRALMGTRSRIGMDIKNIVALVSPEIALKYEALTEYQSVADVGVALSTLLNGQLGWVAGVPLVVTEAIESGDANGAYDSTHAAGTVGQTVIAHRDIIKIAQFQGQQMETDFVKQQRAYQMFNTVELDIQQMEVGGTADLYNTTI